MELEKDKQFKHQRTSQAFNNLSGTEKASIFMLALEKEHAATLFNLMEDDEIKTLTITTISISCLEIISLIPEYMVTTLSFKSP